MTPIEVLIAARNILVGPYLTPKPEWLIGWTGPVEVYIGPDTRWIPAALLDGSTVFALHEGLPQRLDCRRSEVRDLLVRHGCPAWARDVPPAVWCWGMGVGPLRPPHSVWKVKDGQAYHYREVDRKYLYLGELFAFDADDPDNLVGWEVKGDFNEDRLSAGPETGALGRACADLTALRDRCLLEEADGWYVPGNEIGWWPREVSGG